jgi:hypothetical protein
VFSSWRFYAGPGTWAPGQQSARPVPLGSGSISGGSTSADVSSGFSVIRAGGRYWLIQAGVGGSPDIDAYPASTPWGPFDFTASWGLRHGCPHIPAVTSVRASAGSGQERLSWPDAGPGLRYLVYLTGPGQPGDSPVATAYHDDAVLTGLRPGRYVAGSCRSTSGNIGGGALR